MFAGVEGVCVPVCMWVTGWAGAAAALTHTISYLHSLLCCKHVWSNRSR